MMIQPVAEFTVLEKITSVLFVGNVFLSVSVHVRFPVPLR